MPSFAVSSVDSSANTFTATGVAAVGQPAGSVLQTGDRLRLRNSGGALPAASPALVGAQDYWAVRISDNAIKLSDSAAHALAGTNIVDLTGSGTGTHYIEFNIPYASPTRDPAIGTELQGFTLRDTWSALVGIWDLLTGQSESLFSGNVTLAGDLTVGGTIHRTWSRKFYPRIVANDGSWAQSDGSGVPCLVSTGASTTGLYLEIPFDTGDTIVGLHFDAKGNGTTDASFSVVSELYNTSLTGSSNLSTLTDNNRSGSAFSVVTMPSFTAKTLTGDRFLYLAVTQNAAGYSIGTIEAFFTRP